MGKLDGIKNFFGKASCSFGMHNWDKWEYTSRSVCDQKATCLRCNKEGNRVHHNYGDWRYTNENSCIQVQECSHCKKYDSRTIHTWSDWGYLPHGDRHCLKGRECVRCGELESSIVSHSWSSWEEYISGDVRICQRCGFQEFTFGHSWGQWKEYKDTWVKKKNPKEEALSGGDKRKCSRCKKEEKFRNHAWEKWQSLFGEKEGVKCARCGEKVIFN